MAILNISDPINRQGNIANNPQISQSQRELNLIVVLADIIRFATLSIWLFARDTDVGPSARAVGTADAACHIVEVRSTIRVYDEPVLFAAGRVLG